MKNPLPLILLMLIAFEVPLYADANAVVEDGKTVKIHYDVTLEDQKVDSTREREPVAFVFGKDRLMPGLEEGIKGMKAGEKKTMTITPEKGFGQPDPQAIIEVSKERLPEKELKAGMVFRPVGDENQPGGMITEVKDKSVMMDFNHPLAGKTFTVDVEVIEII